MSSFERFVAEVEPALRRALVAARGPEDGRDAAAAALAYAWEHWDRVATMDNPRGYLYRVGLTSLRRRRVPLFPPVEAARLPEVEPGLPAALQGLTEHQRVAVVLVHGWGFRQAEVAELLGIEASSVRNHLARGMAKLRQALEVEVDA